MILSCYSEHLMFKIYSVIIHDPTTPVHAVDIDILTYPISPINAKDRDQI